MRFQDTNIYYKFKFFSILVPICSNTLPLHSFIPTGRSEIFLTFTRFLSDKCRFTNDKETRKLLAILVIWVQNSKSQLNATLQKSTRSCVDFAYFGFHKLRKCSCRRRESAGRTVNVMEQNSTKRSNGERTAADSTSHLPLREMGGKTHTF